MALDLGRARLLPSRWATRFREGEAPAEPLGSAGPSPSLITNVDSKSSSIGAGADDRETQFQDLIVP